MRWRDSGLRRPHPPPFFCLLIFLSESAFSLSFLGPWRFSNPMLQLFLRATPALTAARCTAADTRWTTWRLHTLGTMYSRLRSRKATEPATARAAAFFIA